MPDPNINTGLKTITAVPVASLGSAATAGVGARAIVSDSDVNNQIGRGKTVAGSGTYQALVRSNGTAWKVA